jgi:hypothetical protein
MSRAIEANQVLLTPYGESLDLCHQCGGDGYGEDYEGKLYACGTCGGSRYLDVTDEAFDALMADADAFPELYAPFTPAEVTR